MMAIQFNDSTRVPDITTIDQITRLRLYLALDQKNSQEISAILSEGLNPNFYFDIPHDEGLYQESPLTCAVRTGSMDILKMMLENHADPNLQDAFRNTALIFAATFGEKEMIALFLTKENINLKNLNGYTPLMYAVNGGQREIVSQLVEQGAQVNVQCNAGCTPLMWAVMKNDLLLVRTLLEKGADINLKDKFNRPALGWAILHERKEMLPLLQAKTAKEWPLLTFAIGHGVTDIVLTLLENGANANEVIEEGVSALTMASLLGKKEMVSALLDHGADINHQDITGMTPLLWAITRDKREVVELLLENGAKVDLQDCAGQTALMKAVIKREGEIISRLLEKGAKPAIVDKNNHQAIDFTADQEIQKMLSIT